MRTVEQPKMTTKNDQKAIFEQTVYEPENIFYPKPIHPGTNETKNLTI